MKTIAVIGLGIMGRGIADNFLKAGYRVVVWNRTKDKTTTLEIQGAIVASSIADAVKQSDIIFEVTANDKSSREVWLAGGGILDTANSKQFLITCATLSIEWIDELANKCAEKNFRFFDMPMTGGRIGAETGQLTLLVGGDVNKLSEIKTDLDVISKKVIVFGDTGSGMRYKLILNAIQALHIAGFGEALRRAKTSGLDVELVGNALAERPGGVITKMAWHDYQQTPEPINFSIEWIAKDLGYAEKISTSIDNSLLDATLSIYEQALKKDLGQKDWTEINNE